MVLSTPIISGCGAYLQRRVACDPECDSGRGGGEEALCLGLDHKGVSHRGAPAAEEDQARCESL